jgi:hypothetical protein
MSTYVQLHVLNPHGRVYKAYLPIILYKDNYEYDRITHMTWNMEKLRCSYWKIHILTQQKNHTS